LGLDDIFEQDYLNAVVLEATGSSSVVVSGTTNKPPMGQRYVEEPQLLSRRGRGSSHDGLSPLPTYSPQIQQFNKKQAPRGQWITPPVVNYGVNNSIINNSQQYANGYNEVAQLQARLERSSSNRKSSEEGSSRQVSTDDQVCTHSIF
jgi:hypothetical protein